MRVKLWDEAKNKQNQKDHGISFEVAMLVFEDERYLSAEDYTDENGEMRYQTLGRIEGMLVLVAHVYREIDGIETPWLISARKAVKYEENIYYKRRR